MQSKAASFSQSSEKLTKPYPIRVRTRLKIPRAYGVKAGCEKNEHREQETKLSRKTKRYPSDMTDIESATMQPLPPRAAMRGRRRECDLREAVNALRDLIGAGRLQLAACCATTSRHGRPCIGGFDRL